MGFIYQSANLFNTIQQTIAANPIAKQQDSVPEYPVNSNASTTKKYKDKYSDSFNYIFFHILPKLIQKYHATFLIPYYCNKINSTLYTYIK